MRKHCLHLWCRVHCKKTVATYCLLFYVDLNMVINFTRKRIYLNFGNIHLFLFLQTNKANEFLCSYQSNQDILTVCFALFQWYTYLFDMSPLYSKSTKYNAMQGNSFFLTWKNKSVNLELFIWKCLLFQIIKSSLQNTIRKKPL